MCVNNNNYYILLYYTSNVYREHRKRLSERHGTAEITRHLKIIHIVDRFFSSDIFRSIVYRRCIIFYNIQFYHRRRTRRYCRAYRYKNIYNILCRFAAACRPKLRVSETIDVLHSTVFNCIFV